MNAIRIPFMAILGAAIFVIPLGISAFQQLVFAQVDGRDFVAWRKMTHDFEKNVISGQWNPGDTPPIRELLDAYVQDVTRIFLGGPDTIPALLQSYERDVTSIFDTAPPEGDKRAQHDQIKEFRQLTNDFEKAIAGIVIAASTDNNR